MPEGLDKLAGGVGKAIETIPDLYDDALKPATRESGKTLALIPRAINAALVPLRQWIAEREYKLAETEKLLAQKLEDVAEDKIVTPEAYVAVPAIQAISYSMDREELRNLYANLLAKAMNSDTKDSVHPSFVEIIKQMSPNDATIFKIISESDLTPLIDLSLKMPKGGNRHYINNISWITSYNDNLVRLSLDNLVRLGLIEIHTGTHYTNDIVYNNVRNNDYFKIAKDKLQSNSTGEVVEHKKLLKCTELSLLFYKICIKN